MHLRSPIPCQTGPPPGQRTGVWIDRVKSRGGIAVPAPPCRSWRSVLRRVVELRVPAVPAVGEQIEQVPRAAVGVARAEVVFGHARDAAVVALAEDRDAGLVAGHEAAARTLETHLGGESRACRRVDGEAPAASACELLLCRWAVGRDEHEGGAVLQMVWRHR